MTKQKQVRRLMFSKDAYREMFRMRAKGDTFAEIARRFGCSDVFIGEVIKGRTRTEETAHIAPSLRKKAQSVVTKGGGHIPKPTNGSAAPTPSLTAQQEAEYRDFSALNELVKAKAAVEEANKAVASAYAACKNSGFSDAFIELALDEVNRKPGE